MSLLLVVEDEAQAEFDAAVDRYEAERSGLGGEFIDEMDRLLTRIIEQPDAGLVVRQAPARLRLRRRLAPRFPYAIIYRVEHDTLRVFAFAHMSQKPSYWKARARR